VGTRMRRKVEEAPPRVLVIEDDHSVARTLHLCLSAVGFNVTAVRTGEEALHVAQTEPIDAVVLDLALPDRRGGAVLAWLRRLDRRGGPPWVVISALDREEADRRYGPLGSFLAMPFDPWDLVRKLDELLGRNWSNPKKKEPT
jgi:DNA-binding response OmpR family regulator